MAKILNGAELSAELRREIADDVAGLASSGVVPGLTVVLVGDDPASAAYVGAKARACEKVGITE
ncbi:MAG: tetrahydrofolate dehydrogenase/cyclohydrolase catalytic domain-containing protein, partial [Longimicrobiaceae bacterium]